MYGLETIQKINGRHDIHDNEKTTSARNKKRCVGQTSLKTTKNHTEIITGAFSVVQDDRNQRYAGGKKGC